MHERALPWRRYVFRAKLAAIIPGIIRIRTNENPTGGPS
jgi:hypothetical protein